MAAAPRPAGQDKAGNGRLRLELAEIERHLYSILGLITRTLEELKAANTERRLIYDHENGQ